MLKWRTINYKMKAPPASSRTPRNCIGKQTRSGGGEGRGREGGGKEREIRSYVDSICAVLPIRHGYWIGLDRRVSNTNTRSLDVGRPLPFLFQTEITLSRPTPVVPRSPPSFYLAPFSLHVVVFLSSSTASKILPNFFV